MAKADETKKKQRTQDDHTEQDAQKPSSIMLQRRRVWRACESCRRKKIKCEGNEPTCSQCSASGTQCTWLQTKDRAALSRHYVQELEARLLHMENLFSQIAPVLEQIGPATTTPITGSTSSIPTGSVQLQHALAPRAQDRVPIASSPETIKVEQDLSESMGQLALDEHGHLRWIGGSSTMSLIQSFRAITTAPLHRVSPMEEDPRAPGTSANKLYFPASVFFGKIHALPGPDEVEYPDRDLADKMITAYFTRFHFLMPVIDKPSFIRRYTQLMDNRHDKSFISTETAFISLLFSVFACSAKLVSDPRLSTGDNQDDGGMGMVYYERALILHYMSHSHVQVAHVQCFTLMASFLCSVNCLPQAWLLVGQAVRTGQDLGLHRSPRRLTVSAVDKETRRKIWWGVYSLDRMLALALGRPLGVQDSDCDVEPPIEVDDDFLEDYYAGASMPTNQVSLMKGFASLLSLYEIGGRVLREVYAIDVCKEPLEPEKMSELQVAVESLDNELTKWCDDLPAVFKSQSESDEQVSMGAVLCSHYYSVLTTLHRNFLPVKREQNATPKSTAKAVSSARSCIRLAPSMRDVVPPSHHLAFFIQHLFSSAVILLLYAMHSSEPKGAAAAMEEANSSLPALEKWEGFWPGARKCKELLLELAETARTAIQQAANERAAPVITPPPTSPGPSDIRRRSVTIANTSPGRSVKTKSRRNQSRDQQSSRRSAVSPYRLDSAQRARSTSRKRGHDDVMDPTATSLASYYQTFSPVSAHSSVSPHSSPASVNHPSPSMSAALERPAEPSIPENDNNHYSYSGTLSQATSQYEFDYSSQHQQQAASSSLQQQWGNSEQQSTDMYDADDSYNQMYSGYPQSTSMYDYGEPIDPSGMPPSSPPNASFPGPSLPFYALEFLRSYNPSAPSADQDAWHYDPGAFEYPDLPFTHGSDPQHQQDQVGQ